MTCTKSSPWQPLLSNTAHCRSTVLPNFLYKSDGEVKIMLEYLYINSNYINVIKFILIYNCGTPLYRDHRLGSRSESLT